MNIIYYKYVFIIKFSTFSLTHKRHLIVFFYCLTSFSPNNMGEKDRFFIFFLFFHRLHQFYFVYFSTQNIWFLCEAFHRLNSKYWVWTSADDSNVTNQFIMGMKLPKVGNRHSISFCFFRRLTYQKYYIVKF